MCRYVNRPPVAAERLALSASGRVRYALKTPYRDGSTHILLEPLGLMARRLKRVFGIEIATCACCNGKFRIIASIEKPQVIARILAHRERTAPEQYPPELPLRARATPVHSALP